MVGALAAGVAACAGRRPIARSRTSSGGMVATSQRAATAAGVEVLHAGGTAADAASAAAAALAVTEPMMTGLGGDCFALYYDAATRKVTGLNGSGRAAAALTADLVRARGLTAMPDDGGLPVTVPGACAGWADLVARFGKLPLARALEPAIRLAEDGFEVGPWTAWPWDRGTQRLLAMPTKGAGLLVDGRAPRAHERFRNPALARTLREVAAGGAQAFYRGRIAEAIVQTVKATGGMLELFDLAEHTSTWDDPISTDYRGIRVWECAPNGQGIVALEALNILEGFDLHALDPLGPERLHLITEALRLAFADARAFVGDPRQADIPTAALLAKDYAASRRASIDRSRALADVPHGAPRGRSDTTYLCVVDGAGNACSFINSNYEIFGSGLVAGAPPNNPGCGFVLQDRGALFVLDPGHPDVLAPRKRPYHTIIPGMLTRTDGSLYAPFGVIGGYMQPQAHVQVITALFDDGLAPQAALDRPRISVAPAHSALWPSDGTGTLLLVEEGIAPATSDALAALGHPSMRVDGFRRLSFGRGQIIRRSPDGTLEGGSDRRGDGDVGAA